MKPITQNELAAALGITPPAVSMLKRRGMPVDSVERAQRWRNRHLQTGRMKGVRRIDKPAAGPQAAAPSLPSPTMAAPVDDPDLFDDPDDEQTEIHAYKSARSRREFYQAEMARIALEKETGQLMQANEVLQLVTDAAVVLRTGLEALGARLSPRLVHSRDEAQIRALIDAEVEDLLRELSRQFDGLARQHEAAH